MPSTNRLHSIYTFLKPRRYYNQQLWYLLATTLVLQRHSKFKRMRSCNFFFYNRKRVIHRTSSCNRNWKLTQCLSNTCQIYCVYAIMAASTLLKNTVSIEEWMAAASLWNKETLYPEKNCSLRLSEVTYTEKYIVRNNYFGSHPFLMSCNFSSNCSSMLFQRL